MDFGFLPGHQVKLSSSNCRDYLKSAELSDPFMASLTVVSTITNCKAQTLDLKRMTPFMRSVWEDLSDFWSSDFAAKVML
jgi:hypothetical protein